MPREEKSNVGLWVGIVIGLLLLGGGIFWFMMPAKTVYNGESSSPMGKFDNTP